MEPKIVSLTEENLIEAPEWDRHPFSCKWCLHWEHPELELDLSQEKGRQEAFQWKLTWLRHVREEFGECGKLLYLGDRAVGYAQYAPARFIPNAASYPAAPVSADAVFISCLFIPREGDRKRGLGSLLLRSLMEELRGRGVAAVETFARRSSAENPSGPLALYLRWGFRIYREDEEFPLVRLELSWR